MARAIEDIVDDYVEACIEYKLAFDSDDGWTLRKLETEQATEELRKELFEAIQELQHG